MMVNDGDEVGYSPFKTGGKKVKEPTNRSHPIAARFMTK